MLKAILINYSRRNAIKQGFNREFVRGIANSNLLLRQWIFRPSIEIEHTRNVMLEHPGYMIWEEDETEKRPRWMIESLFQQFDGIATRAAELSDEELIDTLKQFARIAKYNNHGNTLPKDALGAECAVRSKQWSLERLFLVCSIWCSTHTSLHTGFSKVICDAMERHIDNMSSSQLVQAIFYATRIAGEQHCRNIFDARLDACYRDMSLDEIGIVVLSYFRVKFPNKSDMITYIYEALLTADTLEKMREMTLVSFLKRLREEEHNDNQRELQTVLQSRLTSAATTLSLTSAIHIALLGTRTKICNDDVLEIVVKRTLTNLKGLRVKDMLRLMLALNLFDFKSESGIENQLFKAILHELETARFEEIAEFPRMLAQCLRYLVYAGTYSQQLIEHVLDPNTLSAVYGDIGDFDQEILLLNSFVQVNLKDSYRGPLLTEEQCKQMMLRFCADMPTPNAKSMNRTDELQMEIWHCLRDIYKHCDWVHAYPSTIQPCILLVMDKKTYRSVEFTHRYPPYFSGKVPFKEQLTDGNTQLEIMSVLLAAEHSYVYANNGRRLTRGFLFKVNQLKLQGFRPIVIPHFEWDSLPKDQRNKYVIGKINAELRAAKLYC